jgi:hypothetical protein
MGAGINFAINGVPCALDIDGMGERAITESVGSQGPEADVVLKCAWSERYKLIKGLLNSFTAAGLGIIRFSAYPYPDSPNLVALSVGPVSGVKYLTRGDGWGSFRYARVPVHFGRPSWDAMPYGQGGTGAPDPSGRPYTSTRIKAAASMFSPPSGSPGAVNYMWVGGGGMVPGGQAAIIQSTMEVSIARHMMPFLPLYAISQCLGKVNSDSLVFGGDLTFAPEHVLFIGADTELKPDSSTGNRCWEITYSLMGLTDHVWNQLLGPGGVYTYVNTLSTGLGNPMYNSIELNPLLFTDNFQYYYPSNPGPWF